MAEMTREQMIASLTELVTQTVPEDVVEMLTAALQERDEAIRVTAEQRIELDSLRGLVDEFCGEREQYITAIKNCPRGRRADYHRWQGHAESRRQLTERRAKLPASPEEPLHWRTEDGGIAAVMCSRCNTLGGHDDDCPRRQGERRPPAEPVPCGNPNADCGRLGGRARCGSCTEDAPHAPFVPADQASPEEP